MMMNILDDTPSFSWIGSTINGIGRSMKRHYSSFKNGELEVSLGDFVLIRNEESQKPESHEFCHVGKVKDLYETDSKENKYCCEVQWFLRLFELDRKLQKKMKDPDYSQELVLNLSEKWNKQIDAETIFCKCIVIMLGTDVPAEMIQTHMDKYRLYFCRYALTKYVDLDPVEKHWSVKKKSVTKAFTGLREKSVTKVPENLKSISEELRNDIPRTLEANTMPPNTNHRKYLQASDIQHTLNDSPGRSFLQPTPVKSFYSSEKKQPPIIPIDVRRVQKKLFSDSFSVTKKVTDIKHSKSKLKIKVDKVVGEKVHKRTDNKGNKNDAISNNNYKLTRSGRKVQRICYYETQYQFEEKKKTRNGEKNFICNSESETDSDEYEEDEKSLSNHSVEISKKTKSATSANKRKITNKSRKQTGSIVRIRKTQCDTPSTPLEKARANLHVCAVPDTLPCREVEFDEIFNFVESKLLEEQGGCMYISGVPGTGKTATVNEVIRTLEESRELGRLPSFSFVEINALRLTNPQQCYVHLLKALNGITRPPEQALGLLSRHFEEGLQKRMVVLMLDELDMLWTKRQDVLYNLFNWPLLPHSHLVVLAIANTMDLPERLLAKRVASRLGLSRTAFMPYSYQQLQEIVMSRIEGLAAFNPDAVQLVARKVASVSGDARRALDICRRSTELVKEEDDKNKTRIYLVDMKHVDIAIQEMFSSPKIAAIRHASVQEKLFLQAIVRDFFAKGVEETFFHSAAKQHIFLCRLEGVQVQTYSQMFSICSRLYDMRLIILENGKADIYKRIKLNLSVDDVNYALKDSKL